MPLRKYSGINCVNFKKYTNINGVAADFETVLLENLNPAGQENIFQIAIVGNQILTYLNGILVDVSETNEALPTGGGFGVRNGKTESFYLNEISVGKDFALSIDRTITVTESANPDKTSLGQLIEQAIAKKDTDEYKNAVPAVKESYDKALEKAQEVHNNLDATQEEINQAYMDMIEQLKNLMPGDKTELQALYDEWSAKDPAAYTSASYAALKEALDAAKTVLGNDDALQAEIDAAKTALENAYNALEAKATQGQIDVLSDLIAAYSKLNEADYTDDTWSAFEQALNNAKGLLEDLDNAASQAVKNAQTALNDAYNALEKVVDVYAPLQKQLDLVKAQLEQYGDTWIPASVEYVQKAIDKAEQLLVKEDLTAQESQDMILELIDAMSYVFEKGDKVDLQYYVDSVKNLLEDKYTPDSWKVLMDAVEAAQAVLDDENAIDEEIAPVYEALREAVRNLQTIANTGALKVAIDTAQAILDNADAYIAQTLEGLQEELDKATAVYEDRNASQAEVDAALEALMTQINEVRKPANKAGLLAALENAESYNLTNYTAETGAVLLAAMATAQKVIDDPLADQKTVDEAEKALNFAVDSLVLKSTDTEDPSDTENPESPGTTEAPDDNEELPTGDSGVLAVASMTLLSGAALVLAKKRREK